jgi:dihydroorotate dehydrogenase electron transfer subunit
MERAHARLLCRLALQARERGLDVWVGTGYRSALHRADEPCPRFIDDADLNHRAFGLLKQIEHVGMLWLDGMDIVCRLEAMSAGRPSPRFPGPDRVRSLVIVDRADDANPLRREGWSTVFARDLERCFRGVPVAAPLSRPARETTVEVVAAERRGEDAYRIILRSPFVAESARAGQFLLLECTARDERRAFQSAKNTARPAGAGLSVDPKLPLLRRPFGFHRFSGPDFEPARLHRRSPFAPELAAIIEPGRADTFELLFKVVGRGTQRLSRMRPGQELSARAPLGRPVEICPDLDTAILVAGGIGAGPLFALAQELRRQGRSVHAIVGAVDRASAPIAVDEFAEMGVHAALVTEREDGLLVTQYVERHLDGMTSGVTEIFACGPVGMLREVARVSPPGMAVQVLMEQRMACGMGVCRGCVVRMRSEGREPVYRTVCREGPAFRAEEVAWQELRATAG